MIKKNKWTLIIGSIVILLPILAGLLLWNKLPEQVPTHWNASGEVDGWSSKGFAVFGMPSILLALHWICVWATGMDPRNKNQTRKAMTLVLWIVPVLSVLTGALTLSAALGWEPNVSAIMPLFTGVLFVFIGNYLPKCTHNYTIGIKIPWTLDSEENWNATHRFAGKVWFVGGLLMLVCGFLPETWMIVAMILIMTALVVLPVGYSWRFHKRETK